MGNEGKAKLIEYRFWDTQSTNSWRDSSGRRLAPSSAPPLKPGHVQSEGSSSRGCMASWTGLSPLWGTFDPKELASRRMSGVAANANVRTWRAGEDECEGLQEGDVVGKFGEKFIWERGHRTAAQLAPLRRLGDLRADALLDRVSAKQGLGAANDAFEEDIFELIQSGGAAASDPMAKDFLAHYSTPPSWLDESKLQRGQGVFVRYLPAAGATLYYVSLVGGFSAPLVTKVLRATGYLTAAAPRVARRLAETGHMICDCLLDGALTPDSAGWKAVLRVRFLHARVRRALRGKSYWRDAEWGVPINQEDLAVTLLAFSYNVLVGIELIGGEPLGREDQEAYIHLWRYIGWLMGVEEENNPCESPSGAKAWLESIVMHILEPDADSVAVAHHLLRAPRPTFGVAFRMEVCRRFLGDSLADALHLPYASRSNAIYATLYFISLRAYTFLARIPVLGPLLDRFHLYCVRRAIQTLPASASSPAASLPPSSFTHITASPNAHLEIGSDGVPSPVRRSLWGVPAAIGAIGGVGAVGTGSPVGGGCPMRALAGALVEEEASRRKAGVGEDVATPGCPFGKRAGGEGGSAETAGKDEPSESPRDTDSAPRQRGVGGWGYTVGVVGAVAVAVVARLAVSNLQ